LDNNVVELLRALDQELYAPASQGWDGAEVWHRLAPVLKRSNQENEITTRDGVLPPLYQQSV
jgi:hypothetical protein